MSLYNASGDPHQQGNQGWSYTSSCNQTRGVFTDSTSIREQPSGSAVQAQSQILSSLLSAPTSGDGYAQLQLQETQAAQKKEDGLVLDEPAMVIGREEVILAESNPVAATGYHTSVTQNQQQILSPDMHSAYMNKAGHAPFLQGSAHMSAPQEFAAHPSQPVVSYGQDSYSSSCHTQLQRIQPVFMQQQGVGQQPHGPLQQNHGQQQGGLGHQSLSLQQHGHLQGQPQPHGQLQAVNQPPVGQHSHPGQQQATRQHPLSQPQLHQPIANHQHYLGGQMNSVHGQQMSVSQQPMGQSNHVQQVDINQTQLNQSLGQQHAVGQHPLGQQQVVNHQPLVSQQPNIQVNHLNQNTAHRHLRLVNIPSETSSSSHSPLTGHNIQFVSGPKTMLIQQNQQAPQNRHTVLIHCLPQNVISLQTQQPLQNQQYMQNQMTIPNQQAFQGQSFHNQQSLSRLTHNNQSLQNQQPVHSQQSMPSQLTLPNHQSLQSPQTLQHQANLQNQHSMQSQPTSHIDVANQQQSYDPNAGYTGQLHGQRVGMDQHQQQQQACNNNRQQQQQACVQQQQQQVCSQQQQPCVKQEQQENLQQGILHVVHPHSAVSGGHFVSSHHNTQQLSLQQSSQNVIKASMGSPLAHLPNSPQVSQQAPSQVALNNSPQLSVQNPPQHPLQGSPQLSLQSSPQQFLQGSPNALQSSAQIVMLHAPQLSQNKPQLSLQNVSQVGHYPQINCTPHVQNTHQVLQVQNANQVLHVQSAPQTIQLTGNGLSQRPFQVSQQVEINQKGGNQLTGQNSNPTISSSGKGRGQSKAGRGGRGRGRGGRGRGNANSASGLHMAPNHFRPDPPYPPGLESSGVEPAVSHADSCLRSQEQGIQELSVPTPKSEHSGSSPLHGAHIPSLNSYSPPSVSSSVPRLSATNEVWPTPMPCIKQEQADSPPALIVESLSSSSQQSSDCPVLSPSSYLEDIKPSPPVPPSVPAVSMPEVTSPPAQVPDVKPVVPQSPEQKPPLAAPKHKLAEDEEGTAVCKYCGYCSSNFEVCEGCNRKLPPDVKVVVKKRKVENAELGDERERTCGGGKVNSTPSGTGVSVSRKGLYGSKLQTQGTAFASANHSMSNDLVGKSVGRTTFPRRRGSGAGRGGYRSKKPKEPVTVTISSDEDDDPSSDTSQRVSASSVNTSLTTQEEEDGFFSAPTSKPNSFGTSRRNKMQDASGQSVTQQQAAEGLFFEVRGVRIGSMRTSGLDVRFRAGSIAFRVISDTTQQELDFSLYVTDLTCIKFSFSPSQPVLFIKVTPDCGMRLRTQLKMVPDSPEVFDPSSQEIQKSMIVIIVDTMLSESGLRHMLQLYSQMQSFSDFLQEINYDSANDLLVKSTPPVLAHSPGELFMRGYQKIKTSAQSLISHSMNDKGDHAMGTEGQNETNSPVSMSGDLSNDANETMNSQESRGSRSPSPKTGFIGPVEKLLSYPPPPAKGAITITNEDLFCLNEGEFLNDVILDFYLKYLFREKLSEADQQRTHIFSSFFFKRLTQRQTKSMHEEEEKMTPPQRRHSRVKTWTRHVDIFSKDFLLIPINEKAHWFLAVVCFPAMEAQEHINYQPASSPFYDEAGLSREAASTPTQQPKPVEEDGSQDSLPDTTTPSTSSKGDHVLGKVISAETAKKEKSMYNVGLRQACILIMDSLMGPSRNSIIRVLKEYLQVEWDLKRGTERNMLKTVRGGCPKVPQQTNYSDCGVFVLQYAESFFENPIASFSIPMRLENWFPLSKVEKKREEIRNLILRLQTETSR